MDLTSSIRDVWHSMRKKEKNHTHTHTHTRFQMTYDNHNTKVLRVIRLHSKCGTRLCVFFFSPVQIVWWLCCLKWYKPQTLQRQRLSIRLLLFYALRSILSFPNINRQPSTWTWDLEGTGMKIYTWFPLSFTFWINCHMPTCSETHCLVCPAGCSRVGADM